jgi:urease accessory protein
MQKREEVVADIRAGWHASLDLEFAVRADRTYLARRAHVGPLVVQRPFYPEGGVCHAYIVHPPGGIVGSDRLELTAHAGPGSHALLTTPAATKFYRNSGRGAVQSQTLELDRATFEWLPQETILYPHASARVSTQVRLCKQSRFIGWEIVCFGRPASGLDYGQGRVAQDFELWLEGAPLLIDRLRIDGAADPMRAAYGLAGNPVMATLLAYPADKTVLEWIREPAHHRSNQPSSVHFACSAVDGAFVARAVGKHVDQVRAVMENVWRRLRPHVVGRDAVAPRIWST